MRQKQERKRQRPAGVLMCADITMLFLFLNILWNLGLLFSKYVVVRDFKCQSPQCGEAMCKHMACLASAHQVNLSIAIYSDIVHYYVTPSKDTWILIPN